MKTPNPPTNCLRQNLADLVGPAPSGSCETIRYVLRPSGTESQRPGSSWTGLLTINILVSVINIALLVASLIHRG
jgi:hypothetical protein